MLQGFGSGFRYEISNQSGPSTTPGTSVTPGNNSMGSYTTLISGGSVANDLYGLFIHFSGLGGAGNARDTIVNIGIDEAGGTSFTSKIPYLLASNCRAAHGVCYYFPLFIKAGSTIGAQASQNGGTAALRVHAIGFGLPSNPDSVKCGSFVRSFGETTGSSTGTAVTPGTSAAEGSYTQLGAATAEDLWWWQTGYGINDVTMQALCAHLDVAAGDASNKDLLIENEMIQSTTNEEITKFLLGDAGRYYKPVASGTNIYGRASVSTAAADSNTSMMAWGLGG